MALEMPAQQLITVASFETAPDAWIFRNRLASNGINAFVADEHTVNMYWLYSNAVGGVKVQVPFTELRLVREIESLAIPLSSELEIHAADSTSDEPGLDVCRSCGSSDITNTTWSKPWTFVIWLIFGLPVPVYAPTTDCNICGYKMWHVVRIPSQLQLPSQLPTQFGIIHLLVLTTVAAFALGISIHAGVDWQSLTTVQAPSEMPK